MDKKKQIVFVWNYLNWGGAQIYFLAIIKIARPDWDVLVILPRNSSKVMIGFLNELKIDHEFSDHPIDLLPAKTIAKKIGRQTKRIRSEIATYRRLKTFDRQRTVFHIEVAPWQSWLFLAAMSLSGAKVVVTMHNIMSNASGIRDLVWKFRMRFLSRLKGFRIVASNNDTKKRLRPYVSQSFWDKIVAAPTAVDPEMIDTVYGSPAERDQLRERFNIDKDKFVVLSVGQFIDRKGRWVFMDAAKELAAEQGDIQFVWLTPTEPSPSEIKQIEQYQLGEYVRLVLSETVGTERADVLNFFRIADVFALPSYIEGLPIALLEAMSLGIPSVSTNVYAIPEAVINSETGLLIEAGDSAALAASILRLKNDERFRRAIAQTGREFVLKNFDERDSAKKIIAVYDELLTESK